MKGRGKEEPLVFVRSRIPDDEDVEANHQIQKEEEEEGEEEEEEGEDEDVKQLWRIMCVPCDDVVEQNHQMREEETAFIAKGVKRKRGHECDVCEKVFVHHLIWPDTCVLTRTRNRTSAMCARSVLLNLVI